MDANEATRSPAFESAACSIRCAAHRSRGESAPNESPGRTQELQNAHPTVLEPALRQSSRLELHNVVEMLNSIDRHILGDPSTTITSPPLDTSRATGNRTIQVATRIDF